MMENPFSPQVLQKRNEHLNDILAYAVENVPFYHQFKNTASITSFPVVSKGFIREDYDSFHSREYLAGKVHVFHTSGSTGEPFLIWQDKNKRNRVFAEMMYFWGRAGYRIGMRYLFLRLWSPENRKSRLTAWARNLIMWDIHRLDDANMEAIRRVLQYDRRIRMMLGYASTLENLADYLLACGDTAERYSLQIILSGSDILTENTRAKLRKVFGCPVVSVYSNMENGVLAIECADRLEYHLNSASYFIELLKLDSDEPAAEGEPGRIVVTDLFNHAMPLIRYDTGDIAVWKPQADCSWQSSVFASFEGRAVDQVYDARGARISPLAISGVVWHFDKVRQFQFIQTAAGGYTLKVVGLPDLSEDAVIVEKFRELLGQEAEIILDHVTEIPAESSGKRKTVVSLLNP